MTDIKATQIKIQDGIAKTMDGLVIDQNDNLEVVLFRLFNFLFWKRK